MSEVTSCVGGGRLLEANPPVWDFLLMCKGKCTAQKGSHADGAENISYGDDVCLLGNRGDMGYLEMHYTIMMEGRVLVQARLCIVNLAMTDGEPVPYGANRTSCTLAKKRGRTDPCPGHQTLLS